MQLAFGLSFWGFSLNQKLRVPVRVEFPRYVTPGFREPSCLAPTVAM
jgi:hypothetical protein